jgi:N-acetylneuraminic acid mutarotase
MRPLNISAAPISWKQLPDIPDRTGFAAPFAGVSGDALIVAGGANFPDAMPWDGGKKVWYDSVFVLEQPHGEWKKVSKLPGPLGYGVSFTTANGVLCAGGSDATQHHSEVFSLSWIENELRIKSLPSLPKPMANETNGQRLRCHRWRSCLHRGRFGKAGCDRSHE